MMAECFPAREQGHKQRAEESQTLIVTIGKSGWYIQRWWTAKFGVPVKFRELESLWQWDRKWGWVEGVLGHHEQSHNWEILLTVNQQPNNMISVAYVNITVRYSLKTGRENRKYSVFSVSLFFYTLNMYCMKALGVVHFKGNWTNEKKTLYTLPSLCLSRFTTLPPISTVHSHH